MAISDNLSKQKNLVIRRKTNNLCIFCNKFVGMKNASFEHVYNKDIRKMLGIKELDVRVLCISHLSCNKAYEQLDKPYNVENAFNLNCEFTQDEYMQIAVELFLSDGMKAKKFFRKYHATKRLFTSDRNAFETAIADVEVKKERLKIIKRNRTKRLIEKENETSYQKFSK